MFLPHKGEADLTINHEGEMESFHIEWEDSQPYTSVTKANELLRQAEDDEERRIADQGDLRPISPAELERHILLMGGTAEKEAVLLLRKKKWRLTLEKALVEFDKIDTPWSKTALSNAFTSLTHWGVVNNHGSGYGLITWED
jgi:hypothetical protein